MRVTALRVIGRSAASSAAARADPCGANATRLNLNRCADQDFRKADATLNATYKKVMDRLASDSSGGSLLVDAEKAWVAFRDAECAFSSAGSAGGSMHPLVVSGCRASLTQARTRTLNGYLNCKEGDSCALPPN